MTPVSNLGIRAFFAAGALLAVALLVQTILNYEYVSTNLIRQQARRTADERVRNVERAARLSRPQDADAFQAILDDVRAETSDQIASLTLLQADGSVVAAAGPAALAMTPAERARFLSDSGAPFAQLRDGGRDVLIGVFPCRCSLPRAMTDARRAGPPGRALLELGLYRDSLSAPFARLRRNAAIGASAALALFLSVTVLAVRFGAYVRGKQLETQAELARQVQRDLLPGTSAWPAGVDLAAECVPAWQIGGDFYDVVSLSAGRVAFALGDVSGHGISAGLLMALVHGAMSSPAWGASGEDPARAAERLNQLLLAKSSGDRFVSLFWCDFDPRSLQLRYVNAGHPPPLWLRRAPQDAPVNERLGEGGPILGVLSTATYQTASVEVSEGDLLVLFSDGIVEAANRRGEPFGEERLIATVEAKHDRPARAICDAVRSAVVAFTEGLPPQDDQTLLVVRLWRRNGDEPS